VLGCGGWLIAEQLIDQPLARDGPIRVAQQQRQQRSLTRPTDWDRRAVNPDLEWAKDPKFQASAPLHLGRSLL
jgi:hypothetical protein